MKAFSTSQLRSGTSALVRRLRNGEAVSLRHRGRRIARIIPLRKVNGVNRDDPLFALHRLADQQAEPIGDEAMDASANDRRRAVTTDLVVSETATLLRARGLPHLIAPFFLMCDQSAALQVEWITPDRHNAAPKLMLRHLDQSFSFADCASFVVMRELRLHDALATDRHFRIAGFNPLLAENA